MTRVVLALLLCAIAGCAVERPSRFPRDYHEGVRERIARCGGLIDACAGR
jgi:hypothetical protein